MGAAAALRTLAAAAAALLIAAAPAFGLSDGDGLHVLTARQVDSRQLAISVHTAALPGPANIRVLLPAGYDADPGRRYPVLYLLHGTSGGASDWVTLGRAEQTTAPYPLIVVMPDIALGDGGGGWCTNWPNGTENWETFHIDQLIPWVDANFRTIATRDGRAIAGLSQGGFCSISYPARHPDLFATALAYSGAPDIAYDTDAELGSTAIINATELFLDGVPPNTMFGDRLTNEVNWADHDPATLANNLRGMNLFMYFGNGQPGPLDPNPIDPYGTAIEGAVHEDNVDFHNRLDALGIPSFYEDYGNGTHSWPYWARDLAQSIGPIMDDFAHPPPPPARVTYTIAEESYSVFGWHVEMHRAVTEFSTLEDADANGFALAGSGSGSVTTPPAYLPGATYTVTLSGDQVQRVQTAVADAAGRLRVEVPLGPANPYQQYTVASIATGGNAVFTTRVTIAGPPAGAASSSPSRHACRAVVHVAVPRGWHVVATQVRLGGGRWHAAHLRRGVVRIAHAGRRHVVVRVRLRRGAHRRTLRVQRTLRGCPQ